MQTIVITGALGKDCELRTTQKGDQVCSFSLATNQGYGNDKSTNWWRVSVWGKRGASLAPYLLKGAKVAVCGELSIGEYNGKPQFDVRANEIDLTGERRASSGSAQVGVGDRGQADAYAMRGAGGAAYDPDLDDAPPF